MSTEFIVAEISKNWPDAAANAELISQLFEHVIETNWQRGYALYMFDVHRIVTGPGEMNETIIAVFRKTADRKFVDRATRGIGGGLHDG